MQREASSSGPTADAQEHVTADAQHGDSTIDALLEEGRVARNTIDSLLAADSARGPDGQQADTEVAIDVGAVKAAWDEAAAAEKEAVQAAAEAAEAAAGAAGAVAAAKAAVAEAEAAAGVAAEAAAAPAAAPAEEPAGASGAAEGLKANGGAPAERADNEEVQGERARAADTEEECEGGDDGTLREVGPPLEESAMHWLCVYLGPYTNKGSVTNTITF